MLPRGTLEDSLNAKKFAAIIRGLFRTLADI